MELSSEIINCCLFSEMGNGIYLKEKSKKAKLQKMLQFAKWRKNVEFRDMKLVKQLPSTYHIYKSPYKRTWGQWILKETFWFEMIYTGNKNGNTANRRKNYRNRWFAKNELDEVLANTYENLKQIIKLYCD